MQYLPQSSYDRAANLLQKLGILSKAQRYGAADLANQIERILKAPFQRVVPLQPQLSDWIFTIVSTSSERAILDDEEGNEDTLVRPFQDAGVTVSRNKETDMEFEYDAATIPESVDHIHEVGCSTTRDSDAPISFVLVTADSFQSEDVSSAPGKKKKGR